MCSCGACVFWAGWLHPLFSFCWQRSFGSFLWDHGSCASVNLLTLACVVLVRHRISARCVHFAVLPCLRHSVRTHPHSPKIWDLAFSDFGSVRMQSMFDEPRPVDPSKQWGYLDTYGAFFLHCGALSIGCPSEEDNHALHGELPNAPFSNVHLEGRRGVTSTGEERHCLGITAEYKHTVAFTANYTAKAEVWMFEGIPEVHIGLEVTNNFHADMDLMYMAHANFRALPGSELVATHPTGRDDIEVRPTYVCSSR